MSDSPNIRFAGRELGPISIDKLYRMRTGREIDGTAEFFSERKGQWLSLAGIMEDLYPSRDKLAQMRAAGIQTVEIVGSGQRGECPACRALTKKAFPVEQAPELPPPGCRCVPWCRCCIVAKG